MNYSTFVDDILATIGMVHDDSLWIRENVLQNTLYCLHKINTDEGKGDTGKASDGRAASAAESVAIVPVTYNQAPDDTEWPYLYFTLPSEVYDLPFDKGIRFIRYHRPSLPVNCPPSIAGATFTGTTLGSLSAIYGSTYQKPSEKQPYFARYKKGNEDRVALFGMNPGVTKVMVGMLVAPKFLEVEWTDEMPVSPHKLYVLKNMVLELAVWPMSLPQERLRNDGRSGEPGEVIRTSPKISVNNPAVLETPPTD